jgi:hypothetical protein
VEFVVDKVVLVQVFSEYFGSPCQYYSIKCSILIYHLWLADLASGLTLTPPYEIKIVANIHGKTKLNKVYKPSVGSYWASAKN